MWYKARIKTSAEIGGWRYVKVPDRICRDELAGYIRDRIGAPMFSEHYRGVDFRRVEIASIPREVLRAKLAEASASVAATARAFDDARDVYRRLNEDMAKCRVEMRQVRCRYCRGMGFRTCGHRVDPSLMCLSCHGSGKVKAYKVG